MARSNPFARLRLFLAGETAGGVVLIAAAACAMLVANSALAGAYHALLAVPAGPLTVHGWIDEGLMSLFFLSVGLETRAALTGGPLATPGGRVLPCVAAAGGMAVPALVYLAVAGGTAGLARGWAVPVATDIAFALAMLALAGRGLPPSLRLFLGMVAIADDIGAVAIIALFYTARIDPVALVAAAAAIGAIVVMGRAGVRHPAAFVPAMLAAWVALFLSGVHPTIAGVAAAFALPASTAHRVERALIRPVAFLVVPLFGFANAGVSLGAIGRATLADPLVAGIALGLFVGKQAGVFGAVRLAVALGWAQRPEGASWRQVHGVALLCGIGFTMSLFIGGLAFVAERMEAVRLGVLAGSILSAVAGVMVLRAGRVRR